MIEGSSFNQLYAGVLNYLLSYGVEVSPRGIPTVEIRGCVLRLKNPRTRVLQVPGRVQNPAFAVAESVWILSGSDSSWIFAYNKGLARYADGGVLRGAYGPRIRRWGGTFDQLERVRDLLRRDPQSRQAVIQIFDPARDWVPSRDVPCTIGHRFLVRDGALHLHTTMRSQDAWLGLPYDLFVNTVLQELMAGWLTVPIGEYVHTVDSLHLYATDILGAEGASNGQDAKPGDSTALDVPLTVPFEELDAILADVREGNDSSLAPGWRSYATAMASYRHWKAGSTEKAMREAEQVDGPLGQALTRWYRHLADRLQPSPATAT